MIQAKLRIAAGLCKFCKNERLPHSKVFCEHHFFVGRAYWHFKDARTEIAVLFKKKLEAQNYCCAYTNEPLVLGLNTELDHILPVSRFLELVKDLDNIEWVLTKVNHANKSMTRDEFLEFCKIISKRVV